MLHYIIEVFGADADIETLLDSLETNIVDLLINMQSESLTYVELRIDNLTDTITFDVRSLSQIGANASESEPSYVAGGFRKFVSTKITRPGSMRVAGIPETDVINNNWTGAQLAKDNFALALAASVSNGLTGTTAIEIAPVIARQLTPGPPATFVTNAVSGADWSLSITSQVSRKAGVGE